ncbi:MAG: MlaE family lipid ABC transporter permease subunit [Planctomycetes bacterium]|nr:MlaE family lipid ABC transporter permease subunit [Planctomycetota bacterium]
MTATTFTLQRATTADGRLRVELGGRLTLTEGAQLWRQLQLALRERPAEIDLAGVTRLDGGSAALLASLVARQRSGGDGVEIVGASKEAGRLLRLYDCARGGDCAREAPTTPGLLREVGAITHDLFASVRAILAFVGDLAAGLAAALRRPRSVHFTEFGRLLERTGADGVPIVLLINFLVGGILALQGAIQLHRFGGDQFLASLVGLSIVRELGPLMTAILVTGRSGAAFASELGTMTVNEEIDALRMLGQDPQRFLVFPRVLALTIAVPLLTVLGNLIGVFGGLTIAWWYLRQPTTVYLQELTRALDLADVGTGLLKSVSYAIAIGLIACQRGLATRGGAEGVGRSTTSAVVVALFMLVVIDAIWTWVFSALGW